MPSKIFMNSVVDERYSRGASGDDGVEGESGDSGE